MISIWTSLKFFRLVKSKLNGPFADNNFSVAQMVQSFFARVENSVENGENSGNEHFFLLPTCFQSASIRWTLKVSIIQ